ncbi:AzlD family protein [Alysiella crassa]|uniref:Predicted membrane protein n=1 Tax=Alysiella crassa TaxID=153491 RepID=A0A376BUX7_9NEIS|nr:AzlD family protein [Alysiella crassa]UOP06145.1 AzlD family protein [Alysiella crassa]SSY80618.1 Predicted membrane protein [Alysiella crassa]
MISWQALITILGMMVMTYSTRLAGFFLLKNRKFSPKMARVMEAAPACVLLSVIAPHFVSDKPHELIALAITVFAAWRLPMLPTVLIAVSSSAILAWLFQAA